MVPHEAPSVHVHDPLPYVGHRKSHMVRVRGASAELRRRGGVVELIQIMDESDAVRIVAKQLSSIDAPV